MKYISLLFLLIFIQDSFAQEPSILHNYTNKLDYNIKENRNAILINYDYDVIQLKIGNQNAPSMEIVLSKIDQYLADNGINTVVKIISTSDYNISKDRCYEIFTEYEVENIITLSFIPMDYIEFVSNSGLKMGIGTSLPKNHPGSSPTLDIGLFSILTICKFSQDEFLIDAKESCFKLTKGGYKELMDEFEKILTAFGTDNPNPMETEYIFNEIKQGTRFNELPVDLFEKTIYIPIRQEVYIVNKPKGLINKRSAKAMVSANKTVDSDNKQLRDICSDNNLDIVYYNYYDGVDENVQSGYKLLVFESYYKIDDRFESLSLNTSNDNIERRILGQFEQHLGKPFIDPTSGLLVQYYQAPTAYCYYYLKDIKTGNLYLVDYGQYTSDIGEDYKIKSLEAYIKLLDKI